ncbi:hypothetical protein ARGLB_080_00780 [Arthrobacter globiformis NBRC 12137]|uniref:Uncharacterized protein n=1 Tax=Arthrobacter globiformis (strain ATCC 8010 / DSM 20124 / JCM 1332 / NBRC 12137 / NCIMB 8907 / NRRL B-2979 / 168) TaxID=1077972 RepID=H0QQB3_ARTG1|nr:hypothetical protein ARGLB_080_00780 [Arthrobacter globiformis NBRC 12137]
MRTGGPLEDGHLQGGQLKVGRSSERPGGCRPGMSGGVQCRAGQLAKRPLAAVASDQMERSCQRHLGKSRLTLGNPNPQPSGGRTPPRVLLTHLPVGGTLPPLDSKVHQQIHHGEPKQYRQTAFPFAPGFAGNAAGLIACRKGPRGGAGGR